VFTIETRNKRLRAAVKRAARAKAVADGVQDAIARAKSTAQEVEWLRNAPVRDGQPGTGLPSENELKQLADEAVASMRRKSSDDGDTPELVDPLASSDSAEVQYDSTNGDIV